MLQNHYEDIKKYMGLGCILQGGSKYQSSVLNQSITKNWLNFQREIIKEQRYSGISKIGTSRWWNGYNRLG
jgi:hypothetical protein